MVVLRGVGYSAVVAEGMIASCGLSKLIMEVVDIRYRSDGWNLMRKLVDGRMYHSL